MRMNESYVYKSVLIAFIYCVLSVSKSFATNIFNETPTVYEDFKTLRVGVITGSASDKHVSDTGKKRVYEKYLDSLEKYLPPGIRVELLKAPLSELLDLAKRGAVHAVFDLSKNERREDTFSFTNPIRDEIVFIYSKLDFEEGFQRGDEVYALKGSTWGEDAQSYLHSIGLRNKVYYVESMSDLYSKPIFVAGNTSLLKLYPHKAPITSNKSIHVGIIKQYADFLLDPFNSALSDVGDIYLEEEIKNSKLVEVDLIVDVDVRPFFSHDNNDVSVLSKYQYLSNQMGILKIAPRECDDEECELGSNKLSRLTIYAEDLLQDFYVTESIGLLKQSLFTLEDNEQIGRVGVLQRNERVAYQYGRETISYKCSNDLIEGFENGEVNGFIASDLDGHLAMANLGYEQYKNQLVGYESVVFAIPKNMKDSKVIYDSISDLIATAKSTGFIDREDVANTYMIEETTQGKLVERRKLHITYIISLVLILTLCAYRIKSYFSDGINGLYNKRMINLFYRKKNHSHIVFIRVNNNYDDVNDLSRHRNDSVVLLTKQLAPFKCINYKAFRYLDDAIIIFVDCHDDMLIYQCIDEVSHQISKYHLIIDVGIKETTGDCCSDIKLSSSAMLVNSAEKNKNYCHYEYSQIAKSYMDNRLVENSINESLINEGFDCYFQPKIKLDSSEMYGVEVLARLSVNNQTISPDIFVSILESKKKIHNLDYIMIKKTIDYIYEKSMFDVNFSVNVSSKSIASDDFREKVLALISINNDLDNIEFEITETLTRECFDLVQKFILEVREISSIKFSLDDFSTGNSSLLVLDKIHFDTVKMDRSILEILRKNEGGYNHIKEIVNYIKSKESTVCVEGIEDKDDLAIARELNADFGQGWYYGKPMNKIEFYDIYKKFLV
ncbi:hypothetical protein CWO08_00045 [Vibrio sp. 10N.286.48.B8]|nr:hypothetical protein CWO08_00045 [Vibrio sp. 10N.286.48.B8]